MKLPSFKRLYEQDYKDDYKDLIRQLAISLNSGIESLYDTLNNKTTLRENVACTVKDITIRVNSDGTPTSTTIFSLNSPSSILDGCHVIKVTNNTKSTTYPTSGVFITFIQSDKGIEIKHITGLSTDNEYNIRVVAYYQ